MTSRSITLRETYRLMRSEGMDWLVSAFIALVWVTADVQIEVKDTK